MKTKSKLSYVLILLISLSCSNNDTDEPISEPVSLANIQGNWFRVGGNNPANNGIMVNVNEDTGEIILPQESGFLQGDIKWKDIVGEDVNNFNHMELASDYNYYDGEMTLGSDDTLRISVNSVGAGNIQKWVRVLAEIDDCSQYIPSSPSGSQPDTWDEVNETDMHTGLLPGVGDVGGGIYTVTLSNDSGIVPGLKVASVNDTAGAISSGTAVGTSNETERKVSFLAYPGVAYNIEAHYSSYIVSPNPVVNYDINWSFSGKMDCYEPNDIISESKRIPKNQIIEAYALTGYINNSVIANEAQNNDYYKVQLETAKKLKVELLQVPSSVNLSVKILRMDESQVGTSYEEISGVVSEDGAIYNTTTDSVLPAGNYIVRIYIGGTRTTVINDEEATPEHWNMPYKFKVTAVN